MFLLDTHIVCWSVLEAEKITAQTRSLIEQNIALNTLYIADISLWEIAMLINKNRLIVTLPIQHWIQDCMSSLNLKIASMTPEIVADSVQLPGAFHGDPADQLIVATARCLNATLITRDEKIKTWAQSGFVRVISA